MLLQHIDVSYSFIWRHIQILYQELLHHIDCDVFLFWKNLFLLFFMRRLRLKVLTLLMKEGVLLVVTGTSILMVPLTS